MHPRAPDLRLRTGILQLMRNAGSDRAVFIGDDVTDADVFRLKHERILGIRVGNHSPSEVDCCLSDQHQIGRLPDEILHWYLVVSSALWFCVLNSGVHATIAGVIAAFAIPAKAKLEPTAFTNLCRIKIEEIDQMDTPGAHTLQDDRQQRKALEIREAAIRSTAPLQRLEFGLNPVTAFLVLPLFALANANISLVGSKGDDPHRFACRRGLGYCRMRFVAPAPGSSGS
ncbi:MAG: hypothetical protein C0394_12095 [Syntrophus sp. (in: bacteria)]|nr:hypothetical protein [Syntrophus sp. (in: bacteria)]